MKTPEDILKEALGEIRYKLNGTVTNAQLKWALEEYAKLYHKSEAKKFHKPLVSGSLPRTEAEIGSASNAIYNNKNLTYSYREDVVAVLDWVLGGEPFDGLDG